MKVEFDKQPWPRWTVHSVFPFVHRIRHEYPADGPRDVVLEQYFASGTFGFTRRCSWSNEDDRRVLSREGKVMGLDVKRVQDLDALSSSLDGPCFALHGTDDEGRSIVALLPDLDWYGLDANEDPDFGFAETVTDADAELDANGMIV